MFCVGEEKRKKGRRKKKEKRVEGGAIYPLHGYIFRKGLFIYVL